MDNTILEAVNWATKKLASPPSLGTQKQYTKIMRRINTQMLSSKLPGSSNNRNTRSVERSAFRYWASVQISKNSENNPSYVKQIFKIVKKVNSIAKKAELDYSIGKKFPNKQLRKSKRPSLVGLDAKWREKLIELSAMSKYAEAIKIMAICGCRPEEMTNGVILKRQHNTITITIKGAKCSDKTDAGQEWRTLTFDSSHPLIGNIQEGIYQASARALGDAVSHFGEKISKNKKNPISAYSLRHAAASNFKASGLSVEDIAAALGHRSTATMSFYGTKSKGSGMLVLQSVTATSPVRNASRKKHVMRPY